MYLVWEVMFFERHHVNERWYVTSNPTVYTLLYLVDNQEKCRDESIFRAVSKKKKYLKLFFCSKNLLFEI